MKKIPLSLLSIACILHAENEEVSEVTATSKNDLSKTSHKSDPDVVIKKMTIQDALRGAYNHDQNKSAREKAEATHEKYVQARSGMLPTLSLQGQYQDKKTDNSGDLGISTPESSRNKSKTGSLIFQQNLFSGGSTFAKMDQADAEVKKSWADLQKTEQTTLNNAANSYLDVFAAIKSIDIAKANLDFTKQQFESASEKHKVGEETITNVKSTEAQYYKSLADYETSIANLESVKADFNFKTTLQAPNDLEKPNVLDLLPKTLEIAQDLSLNNHYAIKSALQDIDIYQAQASQVVGSFLPKVDFQAQGDRSGNNTSSDNINGRNQNATIQSKNVQFTLSASIPIYEAGSNRSQLRQAYKQKSAAQLALKSVRDEVKAAVKGAWVKVKSMEEQVQAYKKAVEASKLAVNGLIEEQKAGSKTILDVLEQQDKYFKAQKQLVESERDYYKACYSLLSTMGILTPNKLDLKIDQYDPSKDYDNARGRF